ncbi:hypothetical protein LCGC14_0294770 [marine sediment metagenome]|uniref:Uncharacterized protein n=1 Tax=marine sediment metagenome TaxID=412755 RepID=A0A0F9TX16_9ZZZZ
MQLRRIYDRFRKPKGYSCYWVLTHFASAEGAALFINTTLTDEHHHLLGNGRLLRGGDIVPFALGRSIDKMYYTHTIICSRCQTVAEYDDDGKSLDCLPDGVFVDDSGSPFDGLWVCSECMVGNNGDTLPEFD